MALGIISKVRNSLSSFPSTLKWFHRRTAKDVEVWSHEDPDAVGPVAGVELSFSAKNVRGLLCAVLNSSPMHVESLAGDVADPPNYESIDKTLGIDLLDGHLDLTCSTYSSNEFGCCTG
jgi:hypothetical protein